MFQHWLANNGPALRSWLNGRTPDFLHRIIANAALWALVPLALVLALVCFWGGVELLEKATKAAAFIWKAVKHPVAAVKDVVAPEPAATQRDIQGVNSQLAAMMARLDEMGAARVAAGAAPLNPDELARRNSAAADIVGEASPASEAAAREIAGGDLAAAIATLERDARADAAAAAEKWRRIGALVRGVDTAKARAAYRRGVQAPARGFLDVCGIVAASPGGRGSYRRRNRGRGGGSSGPRPARPDGCRQHVRRRSTRGRRPRRRQGAL